MTVYSSMHVYPMVHALVYSTSSDCQAYIDVDVDVVCRFPVGRLPLTYLHGLKLTLNDKIVLDNGLSSIECQRQQDAVCG